MLDWAEMLGNVAGTCRLRDWGGISACDWKRRSDPRRSKASKMCLRSRRATSPEERSKAVALERPACGCNHHEALEGPQAPASMVRMVLHASNWSKRSGRQLRHQNRPLAPPQRPEQRGGDRDHLRAGGRLGPAPFVRASWRERRSTDPTPPQQWQTGKGQPAAALPSPWAEPCLMRRHPLPADLAIMAQPGCWRLSTTFGGIALR